MILVDKKILAGGLAMILAGVIVFATVEQPVGESGMTEEEIIDLMLAEDNNQAFELLSGILIGTGFLLVLISFGARRRDKVKRKEKSPAE